MNNNIQERLNCLQGFKVENSKIFSMGDSIEDVKKAFKDTRLNFIEVCYDKGLDITLLEENNNKVDVKFIFKDKKLAVVTNLIKNFKKRNMSNIILIDSDLKEIWLDDLDIKDNLTEISKNLFSEDTKIGNVIIQYIDATIMFSENYYSSIFSIVTKDITEDDIYAVEKLLH